jgi:hypothetical protein
MSRNCLVACARIAMLAALCGVPATAQTVSGTISGRVVDPSGAVIAGAKITVSNEATGEARDLKTQETGDFSFVSLRPGTYTVAVEQQGFRKFERKGNVLSANDRLSVGSIEMTFGAVTEQVTVTAEGAAVQTASADRSALLSTRQIEMTVSRGRDVMSQLRLLPGVAYNAAADPQSTGGNFGTVSPNMAGQRDTWNSMALDGVTSNNAAAQEFNSATVNLDAIAEVKVLMNNYAAEYGRSGGSIINFVTKSGSGGRKPPLHSRTAVRNRLHLVEGNGIWQRRL